MTKTTTTTAPIRRLTLARETVRALNSGELRLINGGSTAYDTGCFSLCPRQCVAR